MILREGKSINSRVELCLAFCLESMHGYRDVHGSDRNDRLYQLVYFTYFRDVSNLLIYTGHPSILVSNNLWRWVD